MADTTAITCDYCGQIIHQRDPGYRAVFELRALRGQEGPAVQSHAYDVHFRERCLRGILRGLTGTVKVMLGKALPEPETANKTEGE